ncbi:SDR family oxidoreductase [Streptomyces sp. NRRL F-5727]|uniref:SDR family oxidoreductase n=1 Tax=Streptomyces sp. NRRL F-5727 TaxID=1463871 RepID=UPI0007C65065|nr:SDR family oxidoreductase [Streptomyces sp. NRRL F-5727]
MTEAASRINAVATAAIRTGILNSAIEAGAWDEAGIASLQPVNRMGRPTEDAEAITWLASPAASFVTGTILNVDGGYKAQEKVPGARPPLSRSHVFLWGEGWTPHT